MIFCISAISLSDSFCLLANADIKAGSDPSNFFSKSSLSSETCAFSLLISEVTVAFSFLTTPRWERRLITVYVVVYDQPSLSLQNAASFVLFIGSCSHNIRQNLYSLSKILGIASLLGLMY